VPIHSREARRKAIVKMTRACRILICAVLALAPGLAAAAEGMPVKVGVGQKMDATLYKPAGAGPFPAVLVLHTSGGLQGADHQYAGRLAGEGYVSLVPDFFTPYGLSQGNRQQTFTTHAQAIYADFVAAIGMLQKMKEVRADRIGAVGFSNGGYWAVLLAAKGDIQAGVSYYGAVTGAGTDRSLQAFQAAVTAKSSPVLVLHGGRDSTVAAQFAESLAAILRNANAPHEFRLYPSAEHSYDRKRYYDGEATADSWERTRRFLDATLRKSP
jgi:carboxymethylenebutenolidase